MSHADHALGECRAEVRGAIRNLPIDDDLLDGFRENFREDFERELHANPAKWKDDRARITTLSRAIGAFAEFLAIVDRTKPGEVLEQHLNESYALLKDYCAAPDAPGARAAGAPIVREYCTAFSVRLSRE